ncbi:MAG: hypothetical protein AABX80_01485, partial [Nanoarchaeota archaeon]
VDGDRGGKLIIQNVLDNAEVKDIAIAPDGKEVEELAGKEVLMCLRRTIPVKEYLAKGYFPREENKSKNLEEAVEKIELNEEKKSKLKELSKNNRGEGKAIILDSELNEIKTISTKGFGLALEKIKEPKIIIIDGVVTKNILLDAEEAGCQIIVANNFAATSNKIKLLSF